MNNLLIIIQARTTSTRLPGKVLLPLCNKTALEVMLERLDRFKENIVIATTDDGNQQPILDICNKHEINYYEGDVHNVLDRFYKTAIHYKATNDTIIVRLTSDCPLIDGSILEKSIEYFISENCEFVNSGAIAGYPRGFELAIFKFSLLERTHREVTSDYDKEHVTSYMKRVVKKIDFIKNSKDHSQYRLTLDEGDDYKCIKRIYESFDNRIDFTYEELIALLEENKDIEKINSHVVQK